MQGTVPAEMAITIIVREKVNRNAFIKGRDGRVAEAIPSRGWYTSAELEKEALKAAEDNGTDLSKNDAIKYKEPLR